MELGIVVGKYLGLEEGSSLGDWLSSVLRLIGES